MRIDIERNPGTVHRIDPEDPLLPTILPFKVTSITFVGDDDKLQEWHDDMRNKVGISTVPDNTLVLSPSPTTCTSTSGAPACGRVTTT